MSHDGLPPDETTEGAAQAPVDPYPAPPPPASPYQPSPYQPSPYGEPSPYAVVPQPGSAPTTNPYAGPTATAPAFGFGGYASWSSRVVAYLIDAFLGALAGFPLWIGYGMLITGATTTTDPNGVQQVNFHSSGTSTALIAIGAFTSLAFFVWNQCIRQGRTGASLGKSVLALRLVNADMQTIGAGLAFARYLLNIVNALPCYLGFLWPLWDAKRQTFADKLMGTYVIKGTQPQPPVY